jgi:hypothetical protein
MQPTVNRKIAKHVLIGTSSYPLFSVCNLIAERLLSVADYYMPDDGYWPRLLSERINASPSDCPHAQRLKSTASCQIHAGGPKGASQSHAERLGLELRLFPRVDEALYDQLTVEQRVER